MGGQPKQTGAGATFSSFTLPSPQPSPTTVASSVAGNEPLLSKQGHGSYNTAITVLWPMSGDKKSK